MADLIILKCDQAKLSFSITCVAFMVFLEKNLRGTLSIHVRLVTDFFLKSLPELGFDEYPYGLI